jgi:DNA helicase-2/ATP-dependent DNA helicase PcrA
MRVLMFEEGIGPGSAGKIIDQLRGIESVEGVESLGNSLSEKARGGWQNFLKTWNKLLEAGPSHPAELVNKIISSPYRQYLEAEKADSAERLEDLKQLAVFASRYENLEKFLADAALQEAFNLQRQKEKKEKIKEGKIVLSTVHQSKGLEWSAVFVINLSQGAFPNERALREEGGLEEERRLFYVAVTRAKKYLYLTFPAANNRGKSQYSSWGENFMNEPSTFISEIDSELLDDKSSLGNMVVLNDPKEKISYTLEDEPRRKKPGSFLKEVEDL